MKKDWLARELTMEIIVGVFVVMVFLGLGYFTIILSRETWFSDKQQIEIVFDDVMGLSEGDHVVARGMPVGKVQRLVLGERGVCVVASLDYPLSMRKDYRITIVSTSILGGRYLQIIEGSEDMPPLTGVTTLSGERPYDLMGDAAEVVNALKEGLVEGGVIENLKTAVADVQAIIARVNAGQGTLGRLVSEDETLYNDLSAGVASLRQITERLEQGEGMLGRLLQDDGLYQEIEAAIHEVRASIDDMRETAPIVTFTSIFFGAF